MNKEIERKFLLKSLPNLDLLEWIHYERYFIFINDKVEIRIQKKWEKFEFERKEKENIVSYNKEKFEISKEEFDFFKMMATESIIRDSFSISKTPNISIKIYHWKFEGLVRVEVEFENKKQAENFIPLEWFWNEITDSPLWKDSTLLNLSQKEFLKLIK